MLRPVPITSRRGRRRALAWLALTLALLTSSAALATSAVAAAPKLRDRAGLRVISQTRLDARLLVLSVASRALPGPANIRILLPSGYAAHPHRRYPVLYLLHGTSGGAADWTKSGDAEKTTAGLPLIVVMPDIGLGYDGGGWCTNWYNGGAQGVPEWETFHIGQLIPWVDGNLRTIAHRAGRAIAGLSQGGFCSMSYAARHPDLFLTALSYSGAPDTAYDAVARALVTPIIEATASGLDHAAPDAMFGDRASQEVNWADHDPTTLANNLRGMNLLLYTGNGMSGPFDTLVPNPAAAGIEAGVHELSTLFHNRLQALRIPSLFDDYGPGTHSWPYWARDLRQSIGAVVSAFRHPRRTPATISYTTADGRYSVFSWSVLIKRTAEEFSTLSGAGRRGFTLAGSGTGEVVTPRFYKPGARYVAKLAGLSLHRTVSLKADRSGRLHVEVPLGPANAFQQYTAAGDAAGTKVYATSVALRRPRR